MAMSEYAPKSGQTQRLGGIRADFIASLGRKVADARAVLNSVETAASTTGHTRSDVSLAQRDELARRLQTLGASARLLRFDAMAGALKEGCVLLERQHGPVSPQELTFLAQLLDDLPALAWGETGAPGRISSHKLPLHPIAVVVVGGAEVADVLTSMALRGGRSLECERTTDPQTALDLARKLAPDAIVVDVDLPDAADLVEVLLEDPLTEPVPIVVAGTWRRPQDQARYTALGVAKTLDKPLARDALRRALEDVVDQRDGHTARVTLGEPTLEVLATRLADELKRALIDGVDRPARNCRVPLGEGTEVLAALWGAIARIQELISSRTSGIVRYGGDAPEGAIALAPWLHQDLPGTDRSPGRSRGVAADVRLEGRRVLVADDDPAVTWFLSDLLRAAGCEVFEALDGQRALEIAMEQGPDLVVSDVLMPGLDGFSLCRLLRRDIVLRGTPVILLSWKEDLLQRLRELGADATAYMRKESDARAVLARVREALRPRARLEARLEGPGDVRGRLDGLTVPVLLAMVAERRPDARVCLRDASYSYEVELRGGRPRSFTRSGGDGGRETGGRETGGRETGGR
ncbi:MAG: response regulator, partial [Myxococcales bacterium]